MSERLGIPKKSKELPPPKTNMTMENPSLEDVFPVENSISIFALFHIQHIVHIHIEVCMWTVKVSQDIQFLVLWFYRLIPGSLNLLLSLQFNFFFTTSQKITNIRWSIMEQNGY